MKKLLVLLLVASIFVLPVLAAERIKHIALSLDVGDEADEDICITFERATADETLCWDETADEWVYSDDLRVEDGFSAGGATATAVVNMQAPAGSASVPSDVSGLEMWLKADDIAQANGTQVTSWNDRTANSNDYAVFGGFSSPKYVTGALNAHAAVEVESDADRMNWCEPPTCATSGAGPVVDSAFTIFTVYKPPTDNANCGMWGREDGSSAGQTRGVTFPADLATASCDVYFPTDGIREISPNFDNTAETHSLGVVRRDSSDNLYYYHADLSTALTNRTQATTSDKRLHIASLFQVAGGLETGSHAGVGSQLLELVVYTEDLSTGDRNGVYNYLADLYGFPLLGGIGSEIAQWQLSDGTPYGVIDNDGHIGVGLTDLSVADTDADELVLDGAATVGLSIIATGATGTSSVKFGDAADTNIGAIDYDHTNDRFDFTTNTVKNVVFGSTTEGVSLDFSSADAAAAISNVALDIKGSSLGSVGLAIHSSVLGGAGDLARFYVASSTTDYASKFNVFGHLHGGADVATGALPVVVMAAPGAGVHYTNVDAAVVSGLEGGNANNIHEFHLVASNNFTLKSFITDGGEYHESAGSGRAGHVGTQNFWQSLNTFNGLIDVQDETGAPGNPPNGHHRIYFDQGVGLVMRNFGGGEVRLDSQGHTIQDAGTPLATEDNLNFVNYFTIADDSGNNATTVNINTTELDSASGLTAHLASTADPHSVTWEQALQNNAQADTAPIIDVSSATAFTVRKNSAAGDVLVVNTNHASRGGVGINVSPGTGSTDPVLDIAAALGDRARIRLYGPPGNNDIAIRSSRMVMQHARQLTGSEEEDATIYIATATNTTNTLDFGGGSNTQNNATQINFHTDNNNISTGASTTMRLWVNGKTGMGRNAALQATHVPAGMLHIKTQGVVFANEVLTLEQDDVDKQFIDYKGTSDTSAANSISTWAGGNTIEGFVRNEVNGSDQWMPFYGAPTQAGSSLILSIANVSSSPYTAVDATTIICDTSSIAITVDLPAVASNTGLVYIIKNESGGSNDVTVDGSGAETIDGGATAVLSPGSSITIVADSAEWWII